MRLTKRIIDDAEYEGTGTSFCAIWDDKVSGLGVRIYPSGTKSFIIMYRNENGRQRQLTLGRFGVLTLKQARDMARAKLVEVSQGKDPARERKQAREAATVAELADTYIEKHAKPHKKSWKKDKSRIERHIKPAWGSRKPDGITHSDVASLHRSIGEDAPYEANRTLALIQMLFNFAADEGVISRAHPNPADRVTKYEEKKRDRWVTHEEMPALARGIAAESNPYMRAVFWMLLLTGARKSEILRVRWEHVDLDRRELFIPETKTGTSYTLPLSSAALRILGGLEPQQGNPFVFCSHIEGRHLVGPYKAWCRIRGRAGLDDVRIHDLRRTTASWLAVSGYSMLVIKKLLNHALQDVTGVYARMSDTAVRKAVEDLGEQLMLHYVAHDDLD